MGVLAGGLITFGPHANCTLDLCPLKASILQYQPSIPANGIFAGLFGLALIIHVVQSTRGRTWGFATSLACGCILEILGYIGRLILHNNPFNFRGFLMQIVCITVAPVFFCSAIYVLLSQVIDYVDRSASRFPPKLLYWIFIPCDIISLILQATGGALSSVGKDMDAIKLGVDVSLAGLSFQVITLTIFCGLFIDYLIGVNRSASKSLVTRNMKIFLGFMFLSILLIFIRCCYRIAELKDGYSGALFKEENLFIGLESVMMVLAVFCLNVAHPSIGLPKRKMTDGGALRAEKDQTSGDEEAGTGYV